MRIVEGTEKYKRPQLPPRYCRATMQTGDESNQEPVELKVTKRPKAARGVEEGVVNVEGSFLDALVDHGLEDVIWDEDVSVEQLFYMMED